MKKYYVMVDEYNIAVRFYKDEACRILHREDGPAIEYADGFKSYWIQGKLHREDGPAVVWADGSKEYYIHGKLMTKEEFLARNKVDSCDGKIVEIDGKKYKLNPI